MSVQVAARAEPLRKIALCENILLKQLSVEALAAPDRIVGRNDEHWKAEKETQEKCSGTERPAAP